MGAGINVLNNSRAKSTMTRIIAHRGARNLWAENSLDGFRRTAELGVDAVELDLHLTSDGEIVVIHDPLLDRTTNGRGPVADHSLEALQRLRLQDTLGETIPTLAQVLDVFEPTGMGLELEMKTDARGHAYPDLVEKTARMVEARGMVERVRLTCFVPEILEDIRLKAGRFRRLASLDRRSSEMLGGIDRAIQRFLDLDCTIAIERTLLELEIERCCAAIGTERLGVWVPNTPGDLDFWLRQPVAQLTSDRPDIALDLRKRISADPAS
jgi:glycerophosphoryl diester phosphodiesterase